jgi:PAS domain S-box-containing protein
VTERRKAEESLRESQALLKAIVDHAPVGIAIKDREGRYILVGSQPKTVFDITNTEMLGKTPHDIYPRELADLAVAHDRSVLDSGEVSEIEFTVAHEAGPRTILNVKFPIPDAEGVNASIGSIAIDITDRKHAEEALRDSERTLSTLMRNLPGMAYRCENEKTWSDEFTSTGSEALTGYPAEDLLEQKISFDKLIHPDDRDWVWEETQAALAENRPFQFSYRIITKSGEEKWVWEQGSRVSEPGRKPDILVGFITDITEQRRMQEHLRESDKLSALGQLAGGVAHDFNNILMVINGYANLALREPTSATKTANALTRIVIAADKAAGLTKQLLAFGRRQAIERRVIAVAGVLEEVQTLLAPLLGETIELRIDPADEDLHVNTDSAQISQALVNLAINARDAMPDGGEIVIRTGTVEPGSEFYQRHPGAAKGLQVAISVEDGGTGMDEKTAARVFEPFFTTKEQGKGTGLGLAMVYGFVQQSEGAVEIVSEIGAGTRVTIYLPALQRRPTATEACSGEAMSARGETILMAEDDQDLRELTQLFLEDLGYTVLPARNGLEALEIEAAHEGRIDLLLTDAVMPGCGGHELCQLFLESRPGTPLLMMSGYPTRGDFSNVKLPDGIPFLQKPVAPESLARRLRELLDPPAESGAESGAGPGLRETA